MGSRETGSHAALSVVRGCLVVSVQADLHDDLMADIREAVLDRVCSKTLTGVIFDMGAVKAMDSHLFRQFADTARMTSLLGVRSVFVGFNPGVVSGLVDLEVDTSLVSAVRVMDDAIDRFASPLNGDEGEDGSEEPEGDDEGGWAPVEEEEPKGETSGYGHAGREE